MSTPEALAFLFIKDIQGESTDWKAVKDRGIEITNLKFGAEYTGDINSQSRGSNPGNGTFRPFEFDKYVDTSTPKLIDCCVTGVPFAFGSIITYRAAEHGDPSIYVQCDMKNIRVEEYSLSSGESESSESLKISFGRLKFRYNQVSLEGKLIKPWEFKYSNITNTESFD